MGHHRQEEGFTLTEVLVTLSIVALFLALFFQAYMLSEAQKKATMLRASASDIAQSNLRKITKRADVPASAACDSSGGSGNTNNLIVNPNAPGSTIARGTADTPAPPGEQYPWTSSLIPEKLTNTGLPASSVQALMVQYPRGCTASMPAKILSTVNYGSESVVHVAYVVF